MKKTALIHAELSQTIALCGHLDTLTLADAGLPIPDSTQRIDLALTQGCPDLLTTLTVVLSELQIEAVILAQELPEISPELHQGVCMLLQHTQPQARIDYISHAEFKAQSHNDRAVIRTGEYTPYGNIRLVAGVVF